MYSLKKSIYTMTYIFAILIFVFQNCAKVEFASTEIASNQKQEIELTECEKNPKFSKCQTEPDKVAPKNCEFNGQSVLNGAEVTAYQNSSVAYGQSCVKEQRKCTDGHLSGEFNFAICTPGDPNACLFNGITIPHNGVVEAFLTSTVPYGQSCQKEIRTCDDGKLSGNYPYAKCAEGVASDCLFNAKTVPHTGQVMAYLNSNVEYGQKCVGEWRVCTNGNLSGQYTHGSCVENKPSSCEFNGRTIAHNEKTVAYRSSTVAFGQLCEFEERICNNGHLSGQYQYGSCTPGAPAACKFNGLDVLHNTSVTAYFTSSVPFGQSCQSESRTCTNGKLSGGYEYSNCQPAQPASCLFNGKTINHNDSVISFTKNSVAFNDTCENYKNIRKCFNGSLDGNQNSTFESCSTEAPKSCTFQMYSWEVVRTDPRDGDIYDFVWKDISLDHNTSITGYFISGGYLNACTTQSQLRSCYDGSISGSAPYQSCERWPNPGSPLMIHYNSNIMEIEPLVFTSQQDGILFDILGLNAQPIPYAPKRISWYKSVQYFFVALPDKNGEVRGIDQLFGNNTQGPDQQFAENGYLALAKYDGKSRDGLQQIIPADNLITQKDPIFKDLRLWNDLNYDGIGQKHELVSLEQLDIIAIDLNADPGYLETDQYGNQTTLKSVVKTKDGKLHLIFDVWFRYL